MLWKRLSRNMRGLQEEMREINKAQEKKSSSQLSEFLKCGSMKVFRKQHSKTLNSGTLCGEVVVG